MFEMGGVLRVITLCCLTSSGHEYSSTSNVLQERIYTRTTRNDKYFRNKSLKLKTILLWNSFYNTPHFNFGGTGQTPFQKENCSVDKCLVTDRVVEELDRPVEEYDAVLFHMSNIKWSRLPKLRKSHQRYVFFLLESPQSVRIQTNYKDFFNWTMTYRRDSDICWFYGSLTSRPSSIKEDPRSINFHLIEPQFNTNESSVFDLSQKKYLVAWIVSHCQTASGREFYANELASYIPIHIYGLCGNYSCERNSTACFKLLERNYKFYLSFENSLCKDYVTEKLFDVIKYNVVPIVYGGANYSEIMPPMSYINVADFLTPQDLAEYLLYLDKTPDEYVKYFWWKSYYRLRELDVVCKLCEMLHNSSLPHKVYRNIGQWWEGEGICKLQQEIDGNKQIGIWNPWIKVGNNGQHKKGKYLHSQGIYSSIASRGIFLFFIVFFL